MHKFVDDIALERSRTYANLREAVGSARDEVTGLPITNVSRIFLDQWCIEDIAALINELGERVGELTS